MAELPALPSGVYRHYKGPLYFVFGYGHDANTTEDFYKGPDGAPMGMRAVVVYMALELIDAHKGPRLAIRTAEDFWSLVHLEDGTACLHSGPGSTACGVGLGRVDQRFTYIGPTWEG